MSIVGGAFGRVGEDGIGLLNADEALSGVGFVGDVGVVFEGGAAVRTLDGGRIGGLRDVENGVIVDSGEWRERRGGTSAGTRSTGRWATCGFEGEGDCEFRMGCVKERGDEGGNHF